MSQSAMREALKTTAATLLRAGVPCALAGSYALWVHGGPEPDHDVDFIVAEDGVEPAAVALAEAGFDIVRPPEGWLFKAVTEDGLTVDLLHKLAGEVVTVDFLARAVEYEVLAVRMPVMTATDTVSAQLRAMNEHYCDFGAVLPGVRAVREQLDWSQLRAEAASNPFATAFLHLADLLGLTDGSAGPPEA